MEETLRYIKVLNWGYGAFCGSFGDIAPLSLSQDFSSSLEQLGKRLAVVNSLDYEKMFVEATSAKGKANLLKYQSTEDSIGYSLHFMRDREQVLEACKATFKGFKGCADKYKDDKLWDEEQWGTYRTFLDQLERALELSLKQFATAYDYHTISTDEPGKESESGSLEYYCQKAVGKGYLEKVGNGYRRVKGKWTKALLAYFLGRFRRADERFDDVYCPMFGETRLGKARSQLINNKNGDGRPRNYQIVDELFE